MSIVDFIFLYTEKCSLWDVIIHSNILIKFDKCGVNINAELIFNFYIKYDITGEKQRWYNFNMSFINQTYPIVDLTLQTFTQI